MKVLINPGAARGIIDAPPSKSDAHRALIAAALSEGATVRGVIPSGDMRATLSCLEGLGATIERGGFSVTAGGLDPKKIKDCTIDCGESGSTLRFLLPLCLISGSRVTLRGTEKLLSRPLDVYEKFCRERGFTFEKNKDSVTVAGRLAPTECTISMSKSSQFATGLLFALSTLDGDSRIGIEGEAESTPYVDMTLAVMREFGIKAEKTDGVYTVSGGKYLSRSYAVEGDLSNAAFLDALNFVGGNVTIRGIKEYSLQADRVYPELFEKIRHGKECDLRNCPDLAPILFALAAYSGGGTFTGTSRLRYKESDRAAAMKEELEKFGVTLDISENSVAVSGKLRAPSSHLFSHGDHRVAMALAVLCTVTGGTVDGAEAVGKSYPYFFDDLQSLGIEVEKYES